MKEFLEPMLTVEVDLEALLASNGYEIGDNDIVWDPSWGTGNG